MRDLKKYWKEVRELEKTLAGDVWLMSLDDPWRGLTGGVVSEVPAVEAAKLLHSKSHRLATEEEVEAHRAKYSATVREEFRAGLRRRGISIVPVAEGAGLAEGEGGKAKPRNLR